jgi:hypothetical protein
MNRSAPTPGHHRLTLWFSLGLLIGLIISALFALRWVQSGNGTRVSVLGAGKYVSVLITHNQRRVLVASGSNGPAFSNAVGKALPPIIDSIDVVLIDPRASADVIERANSLSSKRVLHLPDPEFADDPQAIRASFVMDLADGVTISLRVSPARSWAAIIETGSGRIFVAPQAEHTPNASISISLNGSFSEGFGTAPLLEIGPTAAGATSATRRAVVGPGNVLAIKADGHAFRLPKDSVIAAHQARDRTISRKSDGTFWSNSARTALRTSLSRRTSSPASAIALATRIVFR